MSPDEFQDFKNRAKDEAAQIEQRARQAGREFEDVGKARFGKRFWAVLFAAVVGVAVLGSMLAKCAAGG